MHGKSAGIRAPDGGLDTVIVVAGRTGVVSVSPERLRAARHAAIPTDEERRERQKRGARIPRGITQAELARRIGLRTSTSVGQWERSQHKPDAENLVALARALGTDPLELLEPGTPVTLRLLRVRAGLTQEAAGAAVGISRFTWAQIEAGSRALWPEEVDTAARALRVSRAKLLAAAVKLPEAAPRLEVLPAELLQRLAAHQREGESLAATIARLLPPSV